MLLKINYLPKVNHLLKNGSLIKKRTDGVIWTFFQNANSMGGWGGLFEAVIWGPKFILLLMYMFS